MSLTGFRMIEGTVDDALVIYGMMGCEPCAELKRSLLESALADQAIRYVNCRPSEARALIDGGLIKAYPTLRVMREGTVVAERIGFAPSAAWRESYFADLSRSLAAAGAALPG